MGLDFSHGDAHWTYGGFHRFRSNLIITLGYTTALDEMFDNNTIHELQHEPIYPLINHSDCDGYLSVNEMKQIIPQLKFVLESWEHNDQILSYDIRQGRELLESMEAAIDADESIEFV